MSARRHALALGLVAAAVPLWSLSASMAYRGHAVIEQAVLVNTTKSRSGDTYGDYRGHSAWAVLQGVGLLDAARSVDFLSADGYERTFTLEELQKEWPQGRPVLGLGTADLGESR